MSQGNFFETSSKISFHFEYAPIRVEGFLDKDKDRVSEVQQGREVLSSRSVGEVLVSDVACGPQHTIATSTDGSVYVTFVLISTQKHKYFEQIHLGVRWLWTSRTFFSRECCQTGSLSTV